MLEELCRPQPEGCLLLFLFVDVVYFCLFSLLAVLQIEVICEINASLLQKLPSFVQVPAGLAKDHSIWQHKLLCKQMTQPPIHIVTVLFFNSLF